MRKLFLLDFQGDMLEKFGNAGLVFLVMAIIIYFLYKEYKQAIKAKDEIQAKFNEFLQTKQSENIEMMTNFLNTLDKTADGITEIKHKLDKTS